MAAASYSTGLIAQRRSAGAVSVARSEIDDLLSARGDENVRFLQRGIRNTMTEHAGVVRDENGLTAGLRARLSKRRLNGERPVAATTDPTTPTSTNRNSQTWCGPALANSPENRYPPFRRPSPPSSVTYRPTASSSNRAACHKSGGRLVLTV
jgi:succinate dehydrogenase/fumarate reductase flavoprotein subunit